MFSSTSAPYVGAVNKVLSQTFTLVGVMWALTALVSAFTASMQISAMTSIVCLLVGLGLIFFIHKTQNSGLGLVGLGLFAVVQGVTLGPIVQKYLSMSGGSSIVTMAALTTAVALFGCAAYAKASKRSFSRMGGFLMAGTLALLVASLANIFFAIPAVTLALSVVGAVLFTAWMLYDIGAILEGTETNYIRASLGIYLDTLNLFLSLLRIFGFLGSSDD